MRNWFNLDSPIMVALSRMTDLVILSFLWFVCCLPVLTIGASTTAMYYTAMKIVRGEEDVMIAPTFFQGFKANFKQATIINIISLVLGAIFLVDAYYWYFVPGNMASISFGIFVALFIWLLCIVSYAYFLQAQFYNTVKQTFVNAAILSMRKIPVTVAVFVLNMLPVLVAFFSLTALVTTLPIWVLLVPGVVSVINAKMFVKMFDPFLKAAKEEAEKEENKTETIEE